MNGSILHFISPPIPYFVDCGRSSFRPGEQHIRRNNIGVFDLVAVLRGSLSICEEEEIWELQEGEALVLRPDALHFGASPCTVDTEIVWVHFQTFGSWRECSSFQEAHLSQATLMENHRNQAYLNHCDVSSIFIPKLSTISREIDELLNHFSTLEQEPQSLRNWKRQETFQSLLQHLSREHTAHSEATYVALAERIELFLRQNYALPITNTMLQQELNYHPNYLAKCMMRTFGMTPLEYLMKYRMEQAQKLLIHTNWSISRIAEEVGFRHNSHFAFNFKNVIGVSPSQFRKGMISRILEI